MTVLTILHLCLSEIFLGLPLRALTRTVPVPFSGDADKVRGFLMQCSLAVARSPGAFPSDAMKLSFFLSLLKGKALAWAEAFFVHNDIRTFPYEQFLRSFA
uniref:DUF4939 domain-containing protein n=1 Tax=Amphilophus citrinellus TaxID=61819 RepID=A0A3Q0RTK7_AMPCI